MNLKKQLACIYTNNFFSGLRITDAVWVALLAARGFSLWEIGVAESVFHMVSLTFEVPSGMAADLLGRRKTLVAGGVCMVLSNLLMAFAPDLFFICLAMALSALANAMFSGTASALTYDSLKQCGRTDDYLRVSANCSQLSMLATAVGSLASTLERFLRFSGFYLLSAAFEGTAAAATALMTEPIVTETQARREKQTFRDLPGQLAQLVRDSITALRATPLTAKLIVSAAVLCIPSDQRATLISVDSMVYSLLMIPASPLVGAVGDTFGQAGAGLAVLGVLVALTGTVALGRKTRAS
mgnify:FL=1